MEDYLGYINNTPSRSRQLCWGNNGIKNRFYALDKNGNSTHTNADDSPGCKENCLTTTEKLKSIQLLSAEHRLPIKWCLPCCNDTRLVTGNGFFRSNISQAFDCVGTHALNMPTSPPKQAKFHGGCCNRFGKIFQNHWFQQILKMRHSNWKHWWMIRISVLKRIPALDAGSDGSAAFLISDKRMKQASACVLDGSKGFHTLMNFHACTWDAKKWKMAASKSYLWIFSAWEWSRNLYSVSSRM